MIYTRAYKLLKCRNKYEFTVDTSTDTISTAAVLSDNDVIIVSSDGVLPSPLSSTTKYFVINSSGTSFQVSLLWGGSAINIANLGTGIHYLQLLKAGKLRNTCCTPIEFANNDCCCFLDPSPSAWNIDTVYNFGDMVMHNLQTYYSAVNDNQGFEPGVETYGKWGTYTACGNEAWDSHPPFGGIGKTPKKYLVNLSWHYKRTNYIREFGGCGNDGTSGLEATINATIIADYSAWCSWFFSSSGTVATSHIVSHYNRDSSTEQNWNCVSTNTPQITGWVNLSGIYLAMLVPYTWGWYEGETCISTSNYFVGVYWPPGSGEPPERWFPGNGDCMISDSISGSNSGEDRVPVIPEEPQQCEGRLESEWTETYTMSWQPYTGV